MLLCTTILTPVLTPFASYMFPKAEDALIAQGLNPKIAEEIAPGEKIRVESGLAAAALGPLYISTPAIAAVNLLMSYKSTNAFTFPTRFKVNMSGNCSVNMNVYDSVTPLEDISSATDIPVKDIKNTPLSKKEMRGAVLLHEMRHCSKDNTGSDFEIEGDADYHAVTILAREFKNPEIIRFVFNERAAHIPDTDSHDISLYLDAKLKGEKPPSEAQIKEANLAAQEFIGAKGKRLSSLPPLARKRVEFYREAQKYFRNPPQQGPAPKPPAGPKVS